MKRIIYMVTVAVSGAVMTAPVHAQTASKEKTELLFKLSPALGESLLETEGNQPVDESEIGLGFNIVRSITDTLEARVAPIAAYSPRVYDDGDPSSQARVAFELRRKLTFGEDQRPLPYTSVSKLGVQTFARYSPSLGFDGAFGKHAFFDNAFAGGVRLGNDVWFHCRQRWIIAAGLGCNPKRKVAVQLTPMVQYTLSDQSGRRRITPQADASIEVPLRDINIRLVTGFESRRFTELRAPSGRLQRDGRATASISFDFVPAIRRFQKNRYGERRIVNDFTLEIGARYVRNRSNDPTKNFDRIFFVPTFSYTRQLD